MKILLVSLQTLAKTQKPVLVLLWDAPGPGDPFFLHLQTEKKATALNSDPNTAQADRTSIQSLVTTVTSLTPDPACEET